MKAILVRKQPRSIKNIKLHRSPLAVISRDRSSYILKNGEFGLKVLTPSFFRYKHLEIVRRSLTKVLKKTRLWINVFPDWAITKKPQEVRQGKGKGDFSHWVVRIPAGRIIFEIAKIDIDVARQVIGLAGKKLPSPVTFVENKSNRIIH